MAEQTLDQIPSHSLAPSIIFITVLAFHFVSKWLEHMKKTGAKSAAEMQLRSEIKELLKEASALSQPSTFAQAAKLRRLAAAKEKEITKLQESHKNELKLSYDLYLRVAFIAKVVMYILLVLWYWRAPVTSISRQLVQPFGKLLSWGAGRNHLSDRVMVGVIPWLIVSTRINESIGGNEPSKRGKMDWS